MAMTQPELPYQHPVLLELDELIRTETVRTRHIQLVRLRSSMEAALPLGLDNLITPESDHSA